VGVAEGVTLGEGAATAAGEALAVGLGDATALGEAEAVGLGDGVSAVLSLLRDTTPVSTAAYWGSVISRS